MSRLVRHSVLFVIFSCIVSYIWTIYIWHGYIFPLRNHQFKSYIDQTLIACHWYNPIDGTTPIHSILDFGAGQGDSSHIFASLVKPEYRYVAVDVYNSTRWIAPSHVQRMIISSNQTILPFKDQEFDLVVITTVLHHISQQQHQIILHEIARITKRIIIIEDLIFPSSRWYNLWVYFFDSLCNVDWLLSPPHSNRDDSEWKILFQKMDNMNLIHTSYMMLGTENQTYQSASQIENIRQQTWSPITHARIVNAIYALQRTT